MKMNSFWPDIMRKISRIRFFRDVAIAALLASLCLPASWVLANGDMDYKALRKNIENICVSPTLSIEQKHQKIYQILPAKDEESTLLYLGKDEDVWDIGDTDQSKPCLDMINNAPSYATIDMIIKKYQEVMDAYPIDIEAITSIEHRIGRYDGYYGEGWYMLTKYMDYSIEWPQNPNIEFSYPESIAGYGPERSIEFRNKLAEQSDDYVLRFMLLTHLVSSGELHPYPQDFNEKAIAGEAIAYAPPELVKTFPKWYNAWNKMVPTMCQRLQSEIYNAQNIEAPQDACGDLLHDPKYRVTKEQQEAWDKENTAQYTPDSEDDETE